MAAKKKLTLYFSEEMLAEIKSEVDRQDRSISWLLQTAWRMARKDIRRSPGVDDMYVGDEALEAV